MASISSANAVLTLSVAGLYPQPQQIQGWSADEFYAVETLVSTETLMGVDGRLSGGFVFEPISQTISLQADSPSRGIFETWHISQVQARDVYVAQALLLLPSIGRKWNMNNGFLKSLSIIPDAGKTLKPRKFVVVWESVTPNPM